MNSDLTCITSPPRYKVSLNSGTTASCSDFQKHSAPVVRQVYGEVMSSKNLKNV